MTFDCNVGSFTFGNFIFPLPMRELGRFKEIH